MRRYLKTKPLRPKTEQWLNEGKYTCSISEFAKLYGFKQDFAYELVKSNNPPPGFYSGNRYKILVDQLPAYMADLAKKRRTVNV